MKFKVGDRIVHRSRARHGVVVEAYPQDRALAYAVRLDDTVTPDFPLPASEEELLPENNLDLRRALVELAEAASLVVAEWDLALDKRPLVHSLPEDIERLRARLTEHMPAIEAAGGGS